MAWLVFGGIVHLDVALGRSGLLVLNLTIFRGSRFPRLSVERPRTSRLELLGTSIQLRHTSSGLRRFRPGRRRPTVTCIGVLVEPEGLGLDPCLLAVLERTTERQSSKLEVVARLAFRQCLDNLGKLSSLVHQCRIDGHNCPQDNDAIADLHVLARVEASFQCPSQRAVPIAHKSTELLVILVCLWSTSIFVVGHSEAMQLSLAAKCFLLVDVLL